jgi:hypothetical protein
MFKRELYVEEFTCPECGAKLSQERELFYCKEHGAFFQYSPQLLVRAPATPAKPGDTVMPWEARSRGR